MEKLDAKDYKILQELDMNFRTLFSKIAKKVSLSKNSISLRFDKLKSLISHATVGINNELLGYKLVKVFYTFDFYDDMTEKHIVQELKKHKNILWAARFYGPFDISICLLVNNLDDLINHITQFNERFSKQISTKEIQIISKQFFFRHDYLHEEKSPLNTKIFQTSKKYVLLNSEKKVLSIIKDNPRMSLIEISKKTKITPKTISTIIKKLEKNKVITGYFATFDNSEFGLNTFKILLQIQNTKQANELEEYLTSLKNIRHFRKMLGVWDYEIDILYPNMKELHKQIDFIKKKFPKLVKRISFVSFDKRIVTNKESFLE